MNNLDIVIDANIVISSILKPGKKQWIVLHNISKISDIILFAPRFLLIEIAKKYVSYYHQGFREALNSAKRKILKYKIILLSQEDYRDFLRESKELLGYKLTDFVSAEREKDFHYAASSLLKSALLWSGNNKHFQILTQTEEIVWVTTSDLILLIKNKFGVDLMYPSLNNEENDISGSSFIEQEITPYEKDRWSRQLQHPLGNLTKIKGKTVVVFGVGGFGTNILLGLVYAGVHNFILVDFDMIELSNLNRQVLYDNNNVGNLKVHTAKQRLEEINPNAKVESYQLKIDYPEDINVLEMDESGYSEDISFVDSLIKRSDYVCNGLDYFGAPYLINDLCVKNNKPFYWGGVNMTFSEFYNYYPRSSACLRCIFGDEGYLRYKVSDPTSPPGITIGNVVISTGNLISQNIITEISGFDNPLRGKFIIFDAIDYEIKKIDIKPNLDCACHNFD